MIVSVYVDGFKENKSAKGNVYGDLFCRGVAADGSADFEQLRLRTFNEEVVAKLRKMPKDAVVDLELRLRDATIEAVAQSV